MEITHPENDQEKISRLEAENSKLREEKAALEALSQTDALTRIPNRRASELELERVLARAERGAQDIAVVVLDIDNFKAINDTYGHLQGDIILKETADFLDQAIRKGDFVSRLGGEEFLLTLIDPGSDLESLIQRIRDSLSPISRSGTKPPNEENDSLTASIGCVLIPRGSQNLTNEKILKLADDEMYKAKNTAGKNTFSIATYQDTL